MTEKWKLGALRKQAGLTQEELAEAAGLSARMIGEYERDTYRLGNASFHTIYKIAEALGVPVESIFLGVISEKPQRKDGDKNV